MLAAQGYQESQLNQNARSHIGAIGVMQIMPATGAELGVGDITLIEPNIHAGAKYMNRLMTQVLSGRQVRRGQPHAVRLRELQRRPRQYLEDAQGSAIKRGLDADKWFNNVEIVVAEKIGIETTTYVRNIYKYYVAYKLMLDAQAGPRRRGSRSPRQELNPSAGAVQSSRWRAEAFVGQSPTPFVRHVTFRFQSGSP